MQTRTAEQTEKLFFADKNTVKKKKKTMNKNFRFSFYLNFTIYIKTEKYIKYAGAKKNEK